MCLRCGCPPTWDLHLVSCPRDVPDPSLNISTHFHSSEVRTLNVSNALAKDTFWSAIGRLPFNAYRVNTCHFRFGSNLSCTIIFSLFDRKGSESHTGHLCAGGRRHEGTRYAGLCGLQVRSIRIILIMIMIIIWCILPASSYPISNEADKRGQGTSTAQGLKQGIKEDKLIMLIR